MKLSKTTRETIKLILCIVLFIILSQFKLTINFIDPVISQTTWYMIILGWLLHRIGIYYEHIS